MSLQYDLQYELQYELQYDLQLQADEDAFPEDLMDILVEWF